jgi:small subunit ribosomal protein S13
MVELWLFVQIQNINNVKDNIRKEFYTMVRLVGVDLPRKKKIAYALTYIHGIGLTSAKKIIELADIDSETRVNDLTTEQGVALRQTLETMDLKLEGDLRRFNGLNIKRLNEINYHRGKRHRNSLPVRGQRTRTNARSRRGAKKTVTGKK